METRHQEHSHSVEGGEHHEKKPVLKKVKDKVKKIKNTISKKAHGHHADDDHEHEHDNDVTSEEEEGYEEDEEEREADPEVHGAPMYESEAARHFVGPGKVTLRETMVTPAMADPSGPKENRFGTTAAGDVSRVLFPSTATGTAAGERRNLIRDRDENIDPQKVALRVMAGIVEEDPSAPKAKTGTPAAATQLNHPSYHPSYPSPTGGDEVGESPLLSSFQAMAVSDKPKGAEGVLESPPTDKPKGAEGPTGTRDQFSPDKPQQDAPKEGTEEHKSSNYTDKISSTATAAKDAAVSAAIGSAEYGKKIASTVYDKVSEAGTAIMEKGMTQEEKNDDIKTGQPGQPEKGVSDKGVSAKEYVVEKLRPGDEDRALSEVISDAMHTKKQEAAGGTPDGAKGSSEESGSGKGMVEKIKGAVTSWIGAGSTAGGVQGSPTTTTTTDTDIKRKEAVTGQ